MKKVIKIDEGAMRLFENKDNNARVKSFLGEEYSCFMADGAACTKTCVMCKDAMLSKSRTADEIRVRQLAFRQAASRMLRRVVRGGDAA